MSSVLNNLRENGGQSEVFQNSSADDNTARNFLKFTHHYKLCFT